MAEESSGDIVYTVRAELAPLMKATEQVNSRLDAMEGRMEKSSKSANVLNTSLTGVAAAMKIFAIAQIGMKVIKMADEFNQLNSRIMNVSDSFGEASYVMGQLYASSSRTGASIASSVAVYESMARAARNSKTSVDDLLAVSSTLQKLGVLGGSSAEDMSNALRQLSQGLSAGIIRAEEYNSIIEQMPLVMIEAAKGMGISTAEIRQMMLDGKLTAESFFEAIKKQTEEVEDRYAKMPRSASAAFDSLWTSISRLVGEMNNVIGLSDKVAGGFDFLSKGTEITAELTRIYFGNATAAEKVVLKTKEIMDAEDRLAEARKNTNAPYSAGRVIQLQETIRILKEEREALREARTKEEAIEKKAVEDRKKKDDEKAALGNKATNDLRLELSRRNELAKVSAREAVRIQARWKAEAAGEKDPAQIKQLEDLALNTYDLEEAKRKETKTTKGLSTEQRQLNRDMSANSSVIQDLTDKLAVSTEATSGAERAAAILSATQRLNSKATQEQRAEVEKLAGALYDQAAAQRKAKEEADKKKRTKEESDAFLKGVKTASMSELEKIDADEAEKMDKLNSYRKAEVVTLQQYEDAKTQITKAAADERKSYELATANAILSQSAALFGGMAEMAKNSQGEASGAYRALFALSQGFAIAQASMNLWMAASQALADPSKLTLEQKMASMGAVVAAGAGLVSSVASVSMGGGRQYGGPVNPGSYYQVNEGNAPEMFQDAAGRQYMMPNTRGEVVSNKDMSGGGQQAPQPFTIINTISGDEMLQAISKSSGFNRAILNSIRGQRKEVKGVIGG